MYPGLSSLSLIFFYYSVLCVWGSQRDCGFVSWVWFVAFGEVVFVVEDIAREAGLRARGVRDRGLSALSARGGHKRAEGCDGEVAPRESAAHW